MIKMTYPHHDFKIRNEEGRKVIFDELRKGWLKLTPEEWVRQNFVQYLLSKNYPSALIAIEKKIMVGEMNKRFDLLVFDRTHQPWMMIECKSAAIPLSADVLHQVLRYNIAIPSKYLVVTNGSYAVTFEKRDERLEELEEFPDFEQSET